jgi:hypothetical protein
MYSVGTLEYDIAHSLQRVLTECKTTCNSYVYSDETG